MQIKLRNLTIGTRIAIALALPITGLLFVSLLLVGRQYQTASNMDMLRRMAELAPAVSALVHELQLERGVSAGFVSSLEGAAFAERLPARHAQTDQRRAELTDMLERYDGMPAVVEQAAYLRPRIEAAREKLGKIWLTRAAIAERSINVGGVTAYYSDAISELIGIAEAMLLADVHPDLNRSIAAYTRLLHMKEQTGLERAIGSAGFAAGRIDSPTYMRIVELINQQRIYLREFHFYATAEQSAFFEKTLYGVNEAEVTRLRRVLLKSRDTGSAEGVDARHWFDSMTKKIDLLKSIEDRLAGDLIAQATALKAEAEASAWRIGLLALLLLALTVSLAAGIARGIILPLKRMTEAMQRLAAGDGAAEIRASDRTDEIGALTRAARVFRESQIKAAQADEQARIAAALRVYRRALSAIVQGVVITDGERRITYANDAFCQYFRISDGAFPGDRQIFLDAAQSGPDAFLAELAPAFAGHYYHGEIHCRGTDGTPFWCEITVTPAADSSGRTTHLVGVLRDVTEARRVEQELRIAATAFESLHGMMVTDAAGTILRVNKAFVEMTGWSAEEAVGQSPAILKSGRHDAEFYADMWRQLAVTGAWEGEIWDRRKNGEIYPKWQTVSAVRGPDGGITHYVAAFSDIGERKEAEQRIHDLAFFDPLTGLPNRRLLLDRLQQALSASARNRQHGALLFIDLDNFKSLNDTLGHDMGDLLLCEVARRLQDCLRGCDTVARLGGDEFVVMLEDLGDDPTQAAADSETVGNKILDSLNRDYDLNGKAHHSSPSIGVTLFLGQETNIDNLLKQADLAMYQAKAAGRNAMRFFDPGMQAVVTARSELEDDLREALKAQQFVLHYQPQVDGEGRITGAEALLRWQHPQRGLVPPAEFIPLAEETGLILPIGDWVLRTACARLAQWRARPDTAALTLAVNVSARQFRHPGFVYQVVSALGASGADPHRLKLELTESLLLDDIEGTVVKMTALKAAGVSFSLDDFGTGYSSLSYLKRLPLDQLKIDRSFVRDVLTDPNDAAIARTIVALGQSLGLTVIAEGVETEEQRAFLAAHNCHAYQGYLFGRPEPGGD
ncbi:EAL domain-containing protein [Azospira restricta]|uniref:EAL domain-containing protein n=1 Tax=Azospira restricta TaxID=404405 RepID=A0A974PWV6_9RHOO|nr:EAL domain-containing protein [Azospira restricta]QRJ62613.1 EAL domain-containing protein [Azospira restricta]